MSKEATRDRYGKVLAELARQDKNVVAMDCDLGRSTRSYAVAEVDPGRFIEMGIAEQDMISTAAGLATLGKIVFVNSFAVFITGRAFDQIRQQISLPNFNVKICGSSAGLTIGPDGATHQSVLDVALMRALPNMTVIVPADGRQTEEAVRAAYRHRGPVYLRLSRYETESLVPAHAEFTIGKALPILSGRDVAIVSCGPVLANVLQAAKHLKADGLSPAVINLHTVKPFDTVTAKALAREYRLVVTVEEHSIFGALGSAMAEAMAEDSYPGPKASLQRIGIQDTFGESGTPDELLRKHGLDPDGIVKVVLQTWNELRKC